MNESQEKDNSASRGSRLVLPLIVALILVLFAVGAAVALFADTETQIMAPGPHYSQQEPRENI